MPGGSRSNSPAVSVIGAIVALIALVGYLVFDWSFNGSANTMPTAIGITVAVSAIGWTLYNRINLSNGA